MIANKKRVRTFLGRLDRLCKISGVNIRGNIAFFDGDSSDCWSDWLELTCNGSQSCVKYIGADEEGFDPEAKLEEMHKDLLSLRVEVLELTKKKLAKPKAIPRKKKSLGKSQKGENHE